MFRRAVPRRRCTQRSAGFALLATPASHEGRCPTLGEGDRCFAGRYFLYTIGRCSVGCAEAKMYAAVGRLCFARLPASQGDAVPLGSPPAGVRTSPQTPAISASRFFIFVAELLFLPVLAVETAILRSCGNVPSRNDLVPAQVGDSPRDLQYPVICTGT